MFFVNLGDFSWIGIYYKTPQKRADIYSFKLNNHNY